MRFLDELKPEMVITMYGIEMYRGAIVPLTVKINGIDHIIRRDDDLITGLGLPGLDVNPKEF